MSQFEDAQNWVYINKKTTAGSAQIDTNGQFYTLHDNSTKHFIVTKDNAGYISMGTGIEFPIDADGLICKPGDILTRIYESEAEASNASLSMYKVIGIGLNSHLILQSFEYPYSEITNSPLFSAESSKYVHAMNSDCDTIAQNVLREAVKLLNKQKNNSPDLVAEHRDSVDTISKLLKFYMHLYYGISFESELDQVIEQVEDDSVE